MNFCRTDANLTESEKTKNKIKKDEEIKMHCIQYRLVSQPSVREFLSISIEKRKKINSRNETKRNDKQRQRCISNAKRQRFNERFSVLFWFFSFTFLATIQLKRTLHKILF